MCGIAGKLVGASGATVEPQLVARMTAALRHRGPDAQGVWTAPGIGLGSRRLAVIDLSDRGRQPLSNEDGLIRVVFNGEIYNFRELRHELEMRGHRFRSASDTEVIVHLYEEEGPEFVRRLDGMFAFALWDARTRALMLARDRLGQKPLFYWQHGDTVVFGSEPKALFQDSTVPVEVDQEAIHHYLTYGYVPAPRSAFKHIRKLAPAHYMMVRDGKTRLSRYWSLDYEPKRQASIEDLEAELDELLGRAVARRLVADVPLGVLLSGGLDSSAVVALMRRSGAGEINTFAIGFDQPQYDERPYARAVATAFDTKHHEFVVRPNITELLPRLVYHYNEPFADSSAVPTWVLTEMAGRSITVALSGDGGDEAFLGYDRYAGAVVTDQLDRLPEGLRRGIARAVGWLPNGSAKTALTRLRRFAGGLDIEPYKRYGRWISMLLDEHKKQLYTPEFSAAWGGLDSLDLLEEWCCGSGALATVERLADADVGMYLPDDLLVKMDIASMANSLEVRSPFLDHQVVEFAASLPVSLKLRPGASKYLLRRVMKSHLPQAILKRRKMGFGVPIDHWLRGDLRELAYDVLLSRAATERGYFDSTTVRRYLDEHALGRAQHHMRIWGLLMLELWHQTFIDQRPGLDRAGYPTGLPELS
ncbi:MAG: asparagine synthase (glutamine-hydrolyzing) [Acidobacteriota bacterium]|nr:asparagine synthase (glutamine-hydrolyzing) [Acidobacteriota bacterium]